MRCPLCALGFPDPHTPEAWAWLASNPAAIAAISWSEIAHPEDEDADRVSG